MANGTGFFISGKGHFITARHVVEGVEVEKMWLEQHRDLSKEAWAGGLVQWPELVEEWPEFDLVVLKADFKRNANKSHLAGLDAFPHVEVELERVADGTPVYSFGYPLPENMAPMEVDGGAMLIGGKGLGPRTTSAIVASSIEMSGMIETDRDPKVYVLDKALNYGNSGGPIVVTETGRAFAVCVRFQPVRVPQQQGTAVMVPSLYGIGSSLANIAGFIKGLKS